MCGADGLHRYQMFHIEGCVPDSQGDQLPPVLQAMLSSPEAATFS